MPRGKLRILDINEQLVLEYPNDVDAPEAGSKEFKNMALSSLWTAATQVNTGKIPKELQGGIPNAAFIEIAGHRLSFDELAEYVESGEAQIGSRHLGKVVYSPEDQAIIDKALGKAGEAPTDLDMSKMFEVVRGVPVLHIGARDLAVQADVETIRSVFPSVIKNPNPNPFIDNVEQYYFQIR